MTDLETHPAGTADLLKLLRSNTPNMAVGHAAMRHAADHIEQLEAALMDANTKIPRFPDHMARIAEAKTAGLPERISAIVAAIQSIPDDMRQYQWQADDKQSFGSKWVRAVVGDNGKGTGRQAIAEVVSHIGVADYIAAANPDSVSLLIAALTRANAAAAAAYEVAAQKAEYFRNVCGRNQDGDFYVGEEATMFGNSVATEITDAIRALATPDQTAALDKLIAEAVEQYRLVLKDMVDSADEISSPLIEAQLLLAASKKGGE